MGEKALQSSCAVRERTPEDAFGGPATLLCSVPKMVGSPPIGKPSLASFATSKLGRAALLRAVAAAEHCPGGGGAESTIVGDPYSIMKPSRRLPFAVPLVVWVVATSSLLLADSPPKVRAVLDAPVDAARDATIAALRDEGYQVSQGRGAEGVVSGRRTRLVGRTKEGEVETELKRICRAQPHVGIDVRGMSEYYVTLTARFGSSDGKTGIDVAGQITAVFRRRGGAGAPLPVALTSSGVLERELVQRVQDRLAHDEAGESAPQH